MSSDILNIKLSLTLFSNVIFSCTFLIGSLAQKCLHGWDAYIAGCMDLHVGSSFHENPLSFALFMVFVHRLRFREVFRFYTNYDFVRLF